MNWISWTAPGSYPFTHGRASYAKSINGEMTMPGGSKVYVKFDGEIITGGGSSEFGTSDNSYWSGTPESGSGAAYKSATLPDLPTNGDRVGVDGLGVATQTISFYSDPARTVPANVSNIVMLVYSLGGASTNGKWDFNRDFTILSDNRSPLSAYGPLQRSEVGGKFRLSANEGTGAVQFSGTYNSVSWDIIELEYYATWNIGVSAFDLPATSTSTTTTVPRVTTTTAAPANGEVDQTSGGLPKTGGEMNGPVGSALLLLGLGSVAIAMGRRLNHRRN